MEEITNTPAAEPVLPGGAEAAMAALTAKLAETPAQAPASATEPALPEAPATPVATPAAAAPEAAEALPEPSGIPTPAVPGDADLLERIERAVGTAAERTRAQREQAERLAAYEARERADAAKAEALRTDPLALARHLADLGWDPDSLVQTLMAQDPKRPETVRQNQLEQRLAETRKELEAFREEARQRDYQRQEAAFKAAIIPALQKEEANYNHMLAMFEPGEIQEAVVGEMTRLYQVSGGNKRATVQEAAASIEAHLRAKVKRLSGLANSAQSAVSPGTPAATVTSATTKPQPRTITPEIAAATDAAPTFKNDDDRLRAAADALRKLEGWK